MRIVLLLGLSLFAAGCARKGTGPVLTPQQRRAVDAAQQTFRQKVSEGVSMSRGPCLGEIMPDWVADVVHNPRQPIDEDPANQCYDYRKGKAHHFVELDTNGELVRVK
jgi:hypothetical protein